MLCRPCLVSLQLPPPFVALVYSYQDIALCPEAQSLLCCHGMQDPSFVQCALLPTGLICELLQSLMIEFKRMTTPVLSFQEASLRRLARRSTDRSAGESCGMLTSIEVHVAEAHGVSLHDGQGECVISIQEPWVVVLYQLPVLSVRPEPGHIANASEFGS